MITTVKLIIIYFHIVTILCVCEERTWNLLSKQISSFQHRIINYSHHAVPSIFGHSSYITVPLYPLANISLFLPPPCPWKPLFSSPLLCIWPFLIPHINGTIPFFFILVWLISLSIVSMSVTTGCSARNCGSFLIGRGCRGYRGAMIQQSLPQSVSLWHKYLGIPFFLWENVAIPIKGGRP